MITLTWCASFQSFYAYTYWYRHSFLGFPGGSDGKESACYEGALGLIPELGRSPGGGHGNPLQYSYLENPHGQRSLAWHGSRGHKVLDTTEQLSTTYSFLYTSTYSILHTCVLYVFSKNIFFYKLEMIFRNTSSKYFLQKYIHDLY